MNAVVDAPAPVQTGSTLRGASWVLLLACGLAAVWLGLNLALPDMQATGIPSATIRAVIHTAILAGLWVGLGRTRLDAGTRIKVWCAVAVPFTVWLAAVWWLAADGVFRPRPSAALAWPMAIFLPILVSLPLLLRSARIGDLLDAMPTAWLVGLQVYRIFGGIFLVAWSRGQMSGTFAIPAGVGDVLVGLLALPVAYLLHAGARGARGAAIVWNVLGILDLTVAVGIGMLSSPGPLQLIVPDRPNALGSYPTVMIPAFAVPSSILLHGLSLRQLLRTKGTGAPPARSS